MIQGKFIHINGIRDYLSPLILSGSLTIAGVSVADAIKLASAIIEKTPDSGLEKNDFVNLIISELSGETKKRYIRLELVKKFILSGKSKSPLFIFISGLTGKTLLSNYVAQHLGVNQTIAIDNEKYSLVNPAEEQAYLWKATYESPEGYIKTVEKIMPRLDYMIDRNIFDFNRYRKWCYLWEGIYLSPVAVKKLFSKYEKIYYLSVFVLPKFEDIKRHYLLRWQSELGIEHLSKRKNIIDKYLENIEAIRGHIAKNIDPVASFVIESPFFEERLTIFYGLLQQKFKDITDKEFPGWVEKIADNPENINEFNRILNGD